MKYIILILFFVTSSISICQRNLDFGYLKLKNCKIIKKQKKFEEFFGQRIKSTQLTVKSKNKLQVTCNILGYPPNRYEVVVNKFKVSYIYDNTNVLYDSINNEIRRFLQDEEVYAQKYPSKEGNFIAYKSFYVNGNQIIPFTETRGESNGNYRIFYIGKHLYKIEKIDGMGYGALSTFIDENIYFIKNQVVIDIGHKICNLSEAKRILEMKK